MFDKYFSRGQQTTVDKEHIRLLFHKPINVKTDIIKLISRIGGLCYVS